jgi:hypothetical protein
LRLRVIWCGAEQTSANKANMSIDTHTFSISESFAWSRKMLGRWCVFGTGIAAEFRRVHGVLVSLRFPKI